MTLTLVNLTDTEAGLVRAIDSSYLLLTGMLILLMQAGFTALEVGASRMKNVKSLLFKNFMDHAVGSLGYFGFGFGIFSGTSPFAGGPGATFLDHAVTDYAYLFNQFGFAATASTIVSGAVTGRMRLEPYVLLSFILVGLVYPIQAKWGWNPYGWLAQMGFLDFAGSCVVHAFGGAAALAGAIACGPRVGLFVHPHRVSVSGSRGVATLENRSTTTMMEEDHRSEQGPARKPTRRSGNICSRWANRIKLYEVRKVPAGHNPALMVLGSLLLYTAWFAFNTSQRSFVLSPETSSKSAINTLLASGAGSLGMYLWSLCFHGKFSIDLACNIMLGSLVAVTAPCGFVDPWAAVVLGFLSTPVYLSSVFVILRVFGVDDTVNAISVHLANGVLGTVWLGLVHPEKGLFYGGGFYFLGVQILGVLVVTALGFFATLIVLLPFKIFGKLSYTADEQLVGIDFVHFGGEFGKDIDLESNAAPYQGSAFRRNSHDSNFSGNDDYVPEDQLGGVRASNIRMASSVTDETSVHKESSVHNKFPTSKHASQATENRPPMNDELRRVMNEDPRIRQRFRAFLKVLHRDEGVEFWDAVLKFKAISKSKNLTKKMNEAKRIITVYCMDTGERQVNLSSKIKKELIAALNDKPERLVENDLFDDALDELFKDLKLSFIEFVNNTPNYWIQ